MGEDDQYDGEISNIRAMGGLLIKLQTLLLMGRGVIYNFLLIYRASFLKGIIKLLINIVYLSFCLWGPICSLTHFIGICVRYSPSTMEKNTL